MQHVTETHFLLFCPQQRWKAAFRLFPQNRVTGSLERMHVQAAELQGHLSSQYNQQPFTELEFAYTAAYLHHRINFPQSLSPGFKSQPFSFSLLPSAPSERSHQITCPGCTQSCLALPKKAVYDACGAWATFVPSKRRGV